MEKNSNPFERRKGLGRCGCNTYYTSSYPGSGWFYSKQHSFANNKQCPWERPKPGDKHYLIRFLKNENGDAKIISFLLIIVVLCFILIAPLDADVYMLKHQQVEQLKNEVLARMRIEGWLSAVEQANLQQNLANIGCVVDSDPNTFIQANAMESKSNYKILRSSDVNASTITLSISCRPEPAPFKPTVLIHGTTPSNVYLVVGGKDLSEYVGP